MFFTKCNRCFPESFSCCISVDKSALKAEQLSVQKLKSLKTHLPLVGLIKVYQYQYFTVIRAYGRAENHGKTHNQN